MSRYLALLLCLIVLAAPACAQDRYAITVPGVVGHYDDWWSMTADFDFGQSFSEISMLEVHFVGQVSPGMSQQDWGGGWFQHVPLGGRFDALITDTDGTSGPDAVYGWPTDIYNTYIDQWYMVSGMLDVIMDGKGSIQATFHSETDPMGMVIQYASADLYDMEIVVTGTPVVPEPSSLLCLAGGVTGLLCYRRRK